MVRILVLPAVVLLAACAASHHQPRQQQASPAKQNNPVGFHQQPRGVYPGERLNRLTDNLMQAASEGDVAKADTLLDQGAMIDGWSGATPYLAAVFGAAANGHLDTLRHLVSRGARLDLKAYGTEYTVLHYAAFGGHPGMLEYLLDQNLDPNVQDARGGTPLHTAAYRGHLDAVHTLIDHGARCDIRDKDGLTAADVASREGHSDVAKYVREASAR